MLGGGLRLVPRRLGHLLSVDVDVHASLREVEPRMIRKRISEIRHTGRRSIALRYMRVILLILYFGLFWELLILFCGA